MYEDKLKELRIFNLSKDMVKSILVNVKIVTRCSSFSETRTKEVNLHSRKRDGGIRCEASPLSKAENTDNGQLLGVWLLSSNSP